MEHWRAGPAEAAGFDPSDDSRSGILERVTRGGGSAAAGGDHGTCEDADGERFAQPRAGTPL
jgi:hypothetical protein